MKEVFRSFSKETGDNPETEDSSDDADGAECECEPSVLQKSLLSGEFVGFCPSSFRLSILFLCFFRRRSILHATRYESYY